MTTRQRSAPHAGRAEPSRLRAGQSAGIGRDDGALDTATFPDRQRWVVDSAARLAAMTLGYALCAAAGVELDSLLAWLLLWPVMGFLLSGAFGAMHRATHGALFPQRRLNEVVGRANALLLLSNFSLFRYVHHRHHKHLGEPEDTEPPLMFRRRPEYVLSLLTTNSFFHFTVPALRAVLVGQVPGWVDDADKQARVRADRRLLLAWLVVLAVSSAIAPVTLLCIYWAPLAWVLLFDAWFSIPEHLRTAQPLGEPVVRSVATVPLVSTLQWDENLHRAHHRYPHLPALSMAEVERWLEPGYGQYEAKGYFRFHLGVWRALVSS